MTLRSDAADAPAVVLGVDLGTSGVKALLVDVGYGRPVGAGARRYGSSIPTEGAHEQDVDDWWQATVDAVRAALAEATGGARVLAVGLSGHMHSLVLLDGDDRPVRPAMTWADRRCSAQVDELRASAARFAASTANPVVEAFTAPKLAWLAANEPAALARATRLVLAKDLLRHRLTGSWETDRTDAWGTLLYDVHAEGFDDELFALVGASADLAPPVVASSQVVGSVLPGAAEALGIEAGVPVVAGASDVACSALGSGVLHPGTALVNAGTAAQILAPSGDRDPGEYFVFAPTGDGVALRMASVYAAGLAVDWAGRTLLGVDAAAGAGAGVDELAAAAPPGAGGVHFVPHLLGTSVPTNLPAVAGALGGLRPGHDRPAVARAVLEGVAFACADAVQHLLADDDDGAIHLAGGLSRSAVLSATLASVRRGPVLVHHGEASPLGAAMLAGVGVGIWSDEPTAVDACVDLRPVVPLDGHEADLQTAWRDWRHAQQTQIEQARRTEAP